MYTMVEHGRTIHETDPSFYDAPFRRNREPVVYISVVTMCLIFEIKNQRVSRDYVSERIIVLFTILLQDVPLYTLFGQPCA
jgi:hypothetical protein